MITRANGHQEAFMETHDSQQVTCANVLAQLFELYQVLADRVEALEHARGGVLVSAQRFTHSTNIRVTLFPGGSPEDDSTWEKVTLRRGGNGEDITVPYTKDGLAALIAVRDGLAPKRKVGAA